MMLADGQGTRRNLMAADLLDCITARKTLPPGHRRPDQGRRPPGRLTATPKSLASLRAGYVVFG